MRAKKPFIIVSVLCVWTILSYIIYVRNSDFTFNGHIPINFEKNEILQKLKLLEDKIKQESDRHDALVRQLISVARSDILHIVLDSSSSGPIIDIKNIEDIGPVHKVAVGHVERIGQEPTDDVSEIREIPLEANEAVAADSSPENKIRALLKENIANNQFDGPVIPVLVFACNRVSVRICLENLLQYRPKAEQFPIIVSQVSVSGQAVINNP